MDMVEKIARAIEGQDVLDDEDRYRSMAIAAIAAMRVPTKGMVDVGTEARWQSAIRDANSVREIWQHMIDAALKEQEKVG